MAKSESGHPVRESGLIFLRLGRGRSRPGFDFLSLFIIEAAAAFLDFVRLLTHKRLLLRETAE